MPWKETTPMQQRAQFILDLETGLYTMSELCRAYQVSRKTGYKWAKRYVEQGVDGLQIAHGVLTAALIGPLRRQSRR